MGLLNSDDATGGLPSACKTVARDTKHVHVRFNINKRWTITKSGALFNLETNPQKWHFFRDRGTGPRNPILRSWTLSLCVCALMESSRFGLSRLKLNMCFSKIVLSRHKSISLGKIEPVQLNLMSQLNSIWNSQKIAKTGLFARAKHPDNTIFGQNSCLFNSKQWKKDGNIRMDRGWKQVAHGCSPPLAARPNYILLANSPDGLLANSPDR